MSDEDDHAGSFALAWDVLGEMTKLDHVGLAPQFLLPGVDEEVAHLHECAIVIVKDSIENFHRELSM